VARDKHSYAFMTRFNADGVRWISPPEVPFADWQQHAIDAFYDAEIRYQDEQLGRLLAYLKNSGALDDTLVIIAADHGEGHGDHGYMGHSFVVYQELVHVPLIVHYPAHFPAGKRVTTPVSTRRIFHTILDVAGAGSPFAADDPNGNLAALSLVRATNGKPDSEQGVVFSEAFPPVNLLNILQDRAPTTVERLQLKQVRRGVVAGAHKLALVGDTVEQLFNMDDDPAEAHNLAAENPALVAALHGEIRQFVASTQPNGHSTPTSDMNPAVLENLRALGYVE
jgi:arylsulfatase A-like enzyme